MSKVERRVRSLVREDGEMRDAVEVILDSATDGEVQWIDVRDEITSGQWGRLIEKGDPRRRRHRLRAGGPRRHRGGTRGRR